MKSKKALIIAALKEISHDISIGVERANFGGCMIIAAIVTHELNKYGVDAEVVTPVRSQDRRKKRIHPNHEAAYPSWGSPSIRSPRGAYMYAKREKDDMKNPEIFSNYGAMFGHVGLRFRLGGRVMTWDSTGIVRRGDWYSPGNDNDPGYACCCEYPFGHGMSAYHAFRIYAIEDWNSDFDVRDIPRIRRMVKDSFARFMKKVPQ